jgi:hypothetical protein
MKIIIKIDPDSTNKQITVQTEKTEIIHFLNQDITDMLKAAHEAGKNNEELSVENILM